MTIFLNLHHLLNGYAHVKTKLIKQLSPLANDFISVFLKQGMTLKKVKSSLSDISKSLHNVNASREYLIKNTRDVVILCSHSIIAAHKGDLRLAKQKIKNAELVLKKNQKMAKDDFKKYLITPEQEFGEACSFLAIIENKEIPSLKSMKVSNESYVLGLLDCVGELKRLMLDNIRKDQLKEADRIFNVMENLFLTLYPFAIFDKIVKEARRKLDVNRSLVEESRAIITEETRRNHFIKSLTEKEN